MFDGEAAFETFLNQGWTPQWDAHPVEAALEMVIIEPRNHRYLRPVLENMSCLVPNASLTILHSELNAPMVESIVYSEGKNNVRALPVLPSNLTRDEYSKLLTTPELWNMFNAPQVLFFQTDSGMRYNNLLRFMQYDYVGAPWNWLIHNDPRISVGNGGFSLRSTYWMGHISREFKFNLNDDPAEDVFFARHLIDCDKAILPAKQDAGAFSVEFIPHADPMAFHQAYKLHPQEWVERWMTTDLAPTKDEATLFLEDAWIETERGHTYPTPELLPWLRIGVSTNGLHLDKGAKLTCIDYDPHPGLRKFLNITYSRNGDRHQARILLDRMRIRETVML